MKFVHIWSYSGLHFPAFGLYSVRMPGNVDQNKSEYGHFSRSDYFSKHEQIIKILQICSHLLVKSLMKNFIFCAVSRIDSWKLKIPLKSTTSNFFWNLFIRKNMRIIKYAYGIKLKGFSLKIPIFGRQWEQRPSLLSKSCKSF